ncbi:MAG: hypothetical protein ACOX4K_05920 [Bacillota bacterium]|jgi:hypothetical protein
MDLESTVFFLQRLYDNPDKHNLTRLEHEALRRAISILSVLVWQEQPSDSEEENKSE